MTLADHRARLARRRADLITLAPKDRDLYVSCCQSDAAEIHGALWRPHLRAEAAELAAGFEALAGKVLRSETRALRQWMRIEAGI